MCECVSPYVLRSTKLTYPTGPRGHLLLAHQISKYPLPIWEVTGSVPDTGRYISQSFPQYTYIKATPHFVCVWDTEYLYNSKKNLLMPT